MLLILGVWCELGLREKLGEEAYQRLKEFLLNVDTPPPESIRRRRQKYNQSGLFIGRSYKPRHKEQKKMREFFRDANQFHI